MSSLACTQADGFYRGTEYDPQRDGGLNKFRGSNGSLGARANKKHMGIMTMRFEMPYKTWCLGCNDIVDQGVRFNAEKKTVGKYFSTRIFEFTFSCPHGCRNKMKMRTDPQNAAYICHEGCRRKNEEYDPSMNETVKLKSVEEKARMAADPMFNMEIKKHVAEEKSEAERRINGLMDLNERHYDPQSANMILRDRHREHRREVARQKALPPTESPDNRPPIEECDAEAAKEIRFKNSKARADLVEGRYRSLNGLQHPAALPMSHPEFTRTRRGPLSREKDLLAKAARLQAITKADKKGRGVLGGKKSILR